MAFVVRHTPSKVSPAPETNHSKIPAPIGSLRTVISSLQITCISNRVLHNSPPPLTRLLFDLSERTLVLLRNIVFLAYKEHRSHKSWSLRQAHSLLYPAPTYHFNLPQKRGTKYPFTSPYPPIFAAPPTNCGAPNFLLIYDTYIDR